jgi:hypothetical protein
MVPLLIRVIICDDVGDMAEVLMGATAFDFICSLLRVLTKLVFIGATAFALDRLRVFIECVFCISGYTMYVALCLNGFEIYV